ncbi:MAG: gephyrin-like molybdotransferase Glp [Rhizobiaceae bacterium]
MSTGRKLLDDCFLHDKDRLRHEECLGLILERLGPVTGKSTVPIDTASGMYLAQDVAAPRDVPLHTNSAVDGYAFAHSSLAATGGTLEVAARIAAGELTPAPLAAGTAARIFTGATLPSGADTVVMQEDCEASSDGRSVDIPAGAKPGSNIRKAGEDLRAGDAVLNTGQRLRPQDIATLASIGFAEVEMFEPVRVALVSSGNELVQPGEPISEGQVYDSNRTMIASLLSSLPVQVTDLGVLADDASIVETKLEQACEAHDLILTSGGASRGEEDHIVEVLDKLGKRHLWQIAIKPGRPMVMGQIGDCAVMGLPGNPVAAFVCFLLYCRPAIARLGGGIWLEPQRFPVQAGFSVPKKKPDRREFWRGWLEHDQDGRLVAQKFTRDGSGLISGLRQATGLIEVTEDVTEIRQGQELAFIPFSQFGIHN